MSKKVRPVQKAEAISSKLAAEMGFEHLETAFEKEAVGLYLRVYLDKPEGITLNDCEAFHRAFQPLVEQLEYDYLEVCSAGLDRPIKNERDAQKALGQEIEIKLFKPLDGKKELTGVLEQYANDEIHLKTAQGIIALNRKDVALARRTVDLSILDEPQTQSEEGTT